MKMRLRHWAVLICFVVGLSIYFLGWLVVKDPDFAYMLVILGFSISAISFVWVITIIYEDIEKRPAYWNRLAYRSLPYLLVVGLILSFLGYFLGRYVHEWGYSLLVLGVFALVSGFGFFIYFLAEYIVKHIKRKRYSL